MGDMNLAEGFGAAGAASGLQELIANRLMRDKLAEAIRAQQAQEDQHQQELDQRKTQFGWQQQQAADTSREHANERASEMALHSKERGEDVAFRNKQADVAAAQAAQRYDLEGQQLGISQEQADEAKRYHNIEAGLKAKEIAAMTDRRNTLTPQQVLQQTRELNAAFTKNTAADATILDAGRRIAEASKALADPKNPNKTAAQKEIIDAFERINNPRGSVRTGTLYQDVGHQSLLDTLAGKLQAAQQGGFGMTDPAMQAFVAGVAPLVQEAKTRYQGERTRTKSIADSNPQLNVDQILGPDVSAGVDLGAPGSAAPVAGTAGSKYKLLP